MNKRIQNLFMEYDELENEYPNLINMNRSILEFHINNFVRIILSIPQLSKVK